MARRKVPLVSRRDLSVEDSWYFYCTRDEELGYTARIAELVREGHTPLGAQRLALKEALAGRFTERTAARLSTESTE